MHIPVEYQLAIGTTASILLIPILKWLKDHFTTKDNESQKLALVSITMGLMVIIPFLGALGLVLALVSFRIKKNKHLSKAALAINLVALLPWLAVLFFGG